MPDTPIDIGFPDAPDLHLRIATGACKVRVAPAGSGDDPQRWVTGTYRDPSGLRPTKVTVEGSTASITPDRPSLGWELVSKVPEYDLALGTAKPSRLSLDLGASDNDVELGGLPLRRAEIRLGAGRLLLRFSAPNPEAMTLLSLSLGAGSVEVTGLANADAAEMVVDGGAAAFKLRFDGQLRRGGHVKVSAGMSSVELAVPATTAAKIAASEAVMSSVQTDPDIVRAEGAYWTPAARQGGTPLLTIDASVSLGALQLRTLAAPPPLGS